MTAPTLVGLADRITVGVQRGAQKERLTEQVAQLKRVEASVAQLTPVVTGIVQLLDAAVGAGVDVPAEGLRGLQGRVGRANADAQRGEVDASTLDALVVDLRAQVSTVQSSITIAWRGLVDHRVPQRQGLANLAETFRQLDASSALATELRQALATAQQLAGAQPSVSALERLEAVAARIPLLLRDLVGDDAGVRSFAEKLARGGAPLESLTPEVERWIEAKGFQQSFKIVPGEPEA